MPSFVKTIICICLGSLSGAHSLATEQDPRNSTYTIEELKIDPAQLCPLGDKRILKTLYSLKKLAPVKSVKRLSCADLLPDESPGCKAEEISYTGMKIIAVAFPKDLWVADLEISDAKFDYLGSNLRVGAPISIAESIYGVKIDRGKSPVVLRGECVPLSIWHENGRIFKVKITCSAC
jgi:hypothetical protein